MDYIQESNTIFPKTTNVSQNCQRLTRSATSTVENKHSGSKWGYAFYVSWRYITLHSHVKLDGDIPVLCYYWSIIWSIPTHFCQCFPCEFDRKAIGSVEHKQKTKSLKRMSASYFVDEYEPNTKTLQEMRINLCFQCKNNSMFWTRSPSRN